MEVKTLQTKLFYPVTDLPDQSGKSNSACRLTQSKLQGWHPAAVSLRSGITASVLRENGIIQGEDEGTLRKVSLYGKK